MADQKGFAKFMQPAAAAAKKKQPSEARMKRKAEREKAFAKRNSEYKKLHQHNIDFNLHETPGQVSSHEEEPDLNNPFAGVGKNPVLENYGSETFGNINPDEITPEFLSQIENVLNFLKSKKKTAQEKKKTVQMAMKQTKEIDPRNIPFDLISDTSHIILPMIGTIVDPSSAIGDGPIVKVNIGSYAWLCVLDRLRLARLVYEGENGIEAFLLETAYYIYKNLNHAVLFEVKHIKNAATGEITTTEVPVYMDKYDTYEQLKNDYFSRERRPDQYRNYSECFTMWYPDSQRQTERLQKGYGDLIAAIRKSSIKSPFAMQKINGQEVKHPHYDFQYGDNNMKDFLRYWTVHPSKVPRDTYFFDDKATSVEYTSTKNEFRYPKNLEFSWVPVEYRAKIEQDFDLIKFAYSDPIKFNKILATWVKIVHEEDAGLIDKKSFYSLVQDLKSNPKTSTVVITMEDEARQSWELVPVQLNLNYKTHSFRKGIDENDTTMREFLDAHGVLSDPVYLPLIATICNADAGRTARKGSPLLEKFNVWKKAGYVFKFSEKYPTLYFTLNAPVAAYKHALFETYTQGGMKNDETYEDCVERFIQRFYQDVLACTNMIKTKETFPAVVPQNYRELLTNFINYNGIPDMCREKMYPKDGVVLENIKNQIKIAQTMSNDIDHAKKLVDAMGDGFIAIEEMRRRNKQIP